jgi:hypothetical protein
MRYIMDQLPDFDEERHMARFAERFVPDEVSMVVAGQQGHRSYRSPRPMMRSS